MAEEKKEENKKSLNMGLIMKIAFVVANLSVTGGGVYLVYASTLGWHSPSITEETMLSEMSSLTDEELAPYIYTMDKFNVNLGGEPKRTIRVEVNLEMLAKDGFEEVMNTESRARARDRIVRLLNDKSFSDLESIQGKLFLKDQIAQEINSVLKTGVVKEIFFSDFVVQ
jgi:flagellar FliL protein